MEMRRALALLAAGVLAPAVLYGQGMTEAPARPRVAVMAFESRSGVSPDQAATVREFLEGDLLGTGKFEVVERGQIDQVLREQGFQASGCTQTECAVQMGQILALQYIVIGSLSKLEETYFLQAKVVEVESARIVDQVRRDSGSLAAFNQITKDLAARLAGLKAPVTITAPADRKRDEYESSPIGFSVEGALVQLTLTHDIDYPDATNAEVMLRNDWVQHPLALYLFGEFHYGLVCVGSRALLCTPGDYEITGSDLPAEETGQTYSMSSQNFSVVDLFFALRFARKGLRSQMLVYLAYRRVAATRAEDYAKKLDQASAPRTWDGGVLGFKGKGVIRIDPRYVNLNIFWDVYAGGVSGDPQARTLEWADAMGYPDPVVQTSSDGGLCGGIEAGLGVELRRLGLRLAGVWTASFLILEDYSVQDQTFDTGVYVPTMDLDRHIYSNGVRVELGYQFDLTIREKKRRNTQNP